MVVDCADDAIVELWKLTSYGRGAGKGMQHRIQVFDMVGALDAQLVETRRQFVIGEQLVPIMQ